MRTFNQNFYAGKTSFGINLVFCGKEACLPSHRFGPSKRPHYLFHYIVSGRGKFMKKTHSYDLSEGQGFLITPGEVTTYQADHDKPWTYLWLCFDGTDAEEILKACGLSRSHPIFNGGDHKAICDLMHRIIDHAMSSTGFSFKNLSLAYEFFELLRQESDEKVTHEVYVDRAIDFIKSNYAYDIQVKDITDAVGLDRTYLFRLLKKTLGVSVQEYLIDYRLRMVKDLLVDESLSITEIAFSSGFTDYSLFYRHFVKAYDMTPKAYKSKIKSL
ncbi:AraC family transcriptional regulator [Acidaminobacter sp. JC074]|uniref:AraC family transcriptional regulator n=1 Tax=Acidaminobacter sp. JC074 TaxID=2530199 RepID=UPI001F1119B4|nr:AraC family transcriptional regulator [Acidaminobacter sp. JC074]MCH4886517.1 AraC family transcriptional regulator [Acidaminobacter sp. JC074]